MASFPVLKAEEEYVLGLLTQNGNIEARNLLVMCNQRAIIKMASEYTKRYPGVEMEDLVAEANIGLINAASHFDPRKGVRFLSYAKPWVIQSVVRCICEDAGIIKLPQHQAERLHKIRLALANGCESIDEISTCACIGKNSVRRLMGLISPVMSLSDEIPAPDCFEEVLDRIAIEEILGKLPERHREILVRYYGLEDKPREDMAEMARRMKVSRQFVHKLKDFALKEAKRRA